MIRSKGELERQSIKEIGVIKYRRAVCIFNKLANQGVDSNVRNERVWEVFPSLRFHFIDCCSQLLDFSLGLFHVFFFH